MKKAKKIIAGAVAAVLVVGGCAGGAVYFKKNNQETVQVVSVDSLASQYYVDNTTLEGNIVTNVMQNVTMDKDMVIQEVYVSQGDAVKQGDKLVSFDMTLVQMELNIARLKQQQQEQDLNKAIKRLNSLKNGGPIEEDTSTGLDLDTGRNSGSLSDDELDQDMENEMASASGNVHGTYLAAVLNPVLAAVDSLALADDFGDGTGAAGSGNQSDGDFDIGFGDGSGDTSAPDTTPVPTTPAPTETPGGTATPAPEVTPTPEVTPGPETTPVPGGDDEDFSDIEIVDTEPNPAESDITDGVPEFYEVLDGDSRPYTGSGTEEDPYVFLCSSANGMVIAKGSFLNKMAAFNSDGTKNMGVHGYWYQLEFHQDDTIMDPFDRKASCIGYYLIDGSLLEEMADNDAEVEYTLDGALQYEEAFPEGGDGSGDGDNTPTMSRAEAIKSQETKVESLRLDIRESKIEINKLERKVKKEVVYSKLDGTVAKVGDPVTGASEDGSAFMTVKSKEGYYVKGTVSELMLDQVKEGTKLTCSGSSGTFEADVVDVSDYPVSSNSYMGNGNPNVSYYTYSATIPDKSVKVSEADWLSITLKNSEEAKNVIVLDRAFVRVENGQNYVYKDDNGTLKKQFLTVEGNTNGGYSVLVKSGITREDKIAFPYGKTVKEGAQTREATLDELYQGNAGGVG